MAPSAPLAARAPLVADAWACAQAAADEHGLRLVELYEVKDHHAAADLLRRIWRADSPDQLVNPGLIRAFAHSGNYVVGAYQGDLLVGTAIGFLGDSHLHSHIAGVDPSRQGSGVGFAVKQHQRAWALERGIGEVRWTFDPLVRRNALFNLHKLGALPTAYLPDFYGAMPDGINAGDATDRLYLRWQLDSHRVVAAAHGEPHEIRLTALGAGRAFPLVDRAGERPIRGEMDAEVLLVAVPRDSEALRRRDPALAAQWRRAVREALTGALTAGYQITGMTRDGFYVLETA
jgi:predicted GNAT superfamily acetyltransferase